MSNSCSLKMCIVKQLYLSCSSNLDNVRLWWNLHISNSWHCNEAKELMEKFWGNLSPQTIWHFIDVKRKWFRRVIGAVFIMHHVSFSFPSGSVTRKLFSPPANYNFPLTLENFFRVCWLPRPMVKSFEWKKNLQSFKENSEKVGFRQKNLWTSI